MNATLSYLGITGVQSWVIHYVLKHSEEGPVLQKDVEEAFRLSRSTITGILQLLEKKGVILRESSASDARLKVLCPTEKAAEMDAQVRASIRETESLLAKDLSPGQIQLFLEVASQMSQNLAECGAPTV